MTATTQLFFIDSNVADPEALIAGLPVAAAYFVLDPQQDGVLQMAEIASGYSELEAIHVISHGAEAQVRLGNAILNGETLVGYESALATLGQALTETGDLLIYGCNVAVGEDGQRFVNRLAQITRADVAASNDLTGGTTVGADWMLEVRSGGVETAFLEVIDYGQALAETTIGLAGLGGTPILIASTELLATGLGPGSVRLGDMDGDGDLDLVTSNAQSQSITINFNNGSGSFGAVQSFAVGRITGDLSLADVDGDGDIDVAVATEPNDAVSVLLNSGAGLLGVATHFLAGDSPRSIVFLDADGDGDQDIATSNIDADTVTLLLNGGSGSFVLADAFAVGDAPSALATGDLDLDGNRDLVVTNRLSGNVSVLMGEGGGAFAAATHYALAGFAGDVHLGDVDGDGDLDLAVATWTGSATISYGLKVLRNDGLGAFGAPVSYSAGSHASAGSVHHTLSMGDFNNDGALDILSSRNDSDMLGVYLNSGTGSFSSAGSIASFAGPTDPVPGDLDGDGSIELVVANQNSSRVAVFKDIHFGVGLDTGDQIQVTATFDSPIAVTGFPGINLLIGSATRLATYVSSSGNTAAFSYTIQSGDKDIDGIEIGAFDLQGGSIKDLLDNDAVLVSSDIGSVTNLAVVNNLAPRLDFFPPNDTPSYIEGGSAVVLDIDVEVVDPELAGRNSYAGATLTLNRAQGANAADVFSAVPNGSLGDLTQGANLVVDGQTIGIVTQNSAGSLVLAFSVASTPSLVNSAMRQIAYANTSGAPPVSVEIDWTFSDGNTGSQGSGGALEANGSVTVSLTNTNDLPTGSVTITGNKTVQTLHTAGNTLADADGLGEIAYQWSRTLTGSWENIDGATDATYYPIGNDIGYRLRVTASYTDDFGALETKNSVATTRISNLNYSQGQSDTLFGGTGNDTLIGGVFGDDLFMLATSGYGVDTIADFEWGDSIRIIGVPLTGTVAAGDGNGVLSGEVQAQFDIFDWHDITFYVGTDATPGADFQVTVTTFSTQDHPLTVVGHFAIRNGDIVTNSLPVAPAHLPDQTVLCAAPFSISVNAFSDPDAGDELTYSATLEGGGDLPVWLAFDPVTRQFSGTSPSDAAGAISLTVTATDLSGASASDTLVLTLAVPDTTRSAGENGGQLEGGSGNDALLGGGGEDSLDGGEGDDYLAGGAGSDALTGGRGEDTLAGGEGDDYYELTDLFDTLIENPGEGIDTVRLTVEGKGRDTFVLPDAVENLLLKGKAAINLTGNDSDNVLAGNEGGNRIDGGTGDDTMTGGRGNDTYVIDSADDRIAESGGAVGGLDLVIASCDYTLGTGLEDLLLSGVDNLAGTGNALHNRLTGNTGDNRLDGSLGEDTLAGGLGNDTYVIDRSEDLIVEQGRETGGIDRVESSISLILGLNLEHLILTGSGNLNGGGNRQDNRLDGNAGKNMLNGRHGDDTLIGGDGNDTLSGGAGADLFVFDRAGGQGNIDRITDFVSGVDRIGFAGTEFDDLNKVHYDSGTGRLYYDTDGSTTYETGEALAVLTGKPAVQPTDFVTV